MLVLLWMACSALPFYPCKRRDATGAGGIDSVRATSCAGLGQYRLIFVYAVIMGIRLSGWLLGVEVGLGWYLQWAQGWWAYANMYAALLIMAIACSGLITLLFRLRDRLLAWQKGLVKW
jgi:hypothetical protein